MGPSIDDRNDLDRRVRAIDWNDKAVEFGSPERCRVAAMMVESKLVEARLRPVYPQTEQWKIMSEYTTMKIAEKIIGRSLGSKSAQWNWEGLWNPREEASFSGWVRQLAYVVARTNARRVLHPTGAIPASRFEGEDGFNPVWDAQSSKPLGTPATSSPFDRVPDLIVPRPIGVDRTLLTRTLTDEGAAAVVTRARAMGWWHRSLSGVDSDGLRAALLLQPLPRASRGILARTLPDMEELAGLYEATQMSTVVKDVTSLRRAVMRRAIRDGVVEWQVWCRLGTAAARLAVG